MTAVPAWVPFDETEVRKPGSCPLGSVSNVCSWTRVGLGEVWTFQVKTRLALVTTPAHAIRTLVVGFRAPAVLTDIESSENLVGAARREFAQVLLVHEKHPAILAEGNGKVRNRTALR